MQYRKIYMQTDSISRHADFDMWYEDGDLFLTAKSLNTENPWSSEKDKIALIRSTGAEMARIKPDNKALEYFVRVERWEYTLRTYTLFKHYYFKGMLWEINGSMDKMPLKFVNESTGKSDVRVTLVKDFRDKGPCYEIKVRDISKLRIAACAVLAIALKEEYRGTSEGEPEENDTWAKKMKRYFWQKGITYDELVEAGRIEARD